jgi:phage portal protein BeeE
LNRWVSQFESELNLKLFGRENKENLYCKFNLDGLLRGDLKSRMEAHAMAINTGIRTPNEVRIKENLPAKKEGNKLMIQGATVPIASQGQMTEAQRSQMETDQAVRKALND